jgi:hypothetical protein
MGRLKEKRLAKNVKSKIRSEIIVDKQVRVKPLETVHKPSMEQMLKENLSCEMFHFILNVFYSPRLIVKIILLLFILISTGLASYMTLTLILNYFEYNVNTLTRTINESPVVFPKVTLCNKNLFTTKYAHDFLMNSSLLNLPQLKNMLNFDRNSLLVYFMMLRQNLFGQVFKTFSNEQKKSLSHRLDDTLLSCLFEYKSCNANDFYWEWDSHYGNCYSFNSGFNSSGENVELRKTYIDGSTFGLQIEFYVNFYEELMFFNSISNDYGLVIRPSHSF